MRKISSNIIRCGWPIFRQNEPHLVAFVERSRKNISKVPVVRATAIVSRRRTSYLV